MKVDLHWRLEPRRNPDGDLQRGFGAELGDPLWLLGRQWQMGEHAGENASTPLLVEITASETPIETAEDRPAQDPRMIPAEAIVEGGTEDTWTIGRRIGVGLKAVSEGLAPAVDETTDPSLLLNDLPAPYRGLSGRVYDGFALLHSPLFDLSSILPSAAQAGDHWMSDELAYRTSFPCGDTVLRVDRHDGGDVDWWTVDAARPLTSTTPPALRRARPGRFTYPGAPHPRFWQIEDRHVDIGGFPPDRSHFATLLLIELIATHSDDWFTFPFLTHAGYVLTLHGVRVTDSFGERWPAPGASWEPMPPDEWAVFKVRGLDPPAALGVLQMPHSLPVWPTAATPLSGPPMDEVVLGVDEDANLLWAVEHRVNGVETTQPPPASRAGGTTGAPLVYSPTSSVPFGWHPYEIHGDDTDPAVPGRRRFVQARLAELHTDKPSELRPAPRAQVLNPALGIHQIAPSTIPTNGLRLEQRFMLARGTDGRPVLWVQRQRLPLLGPPSHSRRVDLAEPAPVRPVMATDRPPLPQPGPLPPTDDPLIAMVLPAEPDTSPPITLRLGRSIPDRPQQQMADVTSLPELAPDPVSPDSSVVFAQALLNAAGALPASGMPLMVDGIFGPETSESLASFQSTRGLGSTGVIDLATWTALLPFVPAAVLLPGDPPPSGPPIASVQALLNRLGIRPLLDVNGTLDAATAASLMTFQTSRFLVPTGGLDPVTWIALSAAEKDARTPIAAVRLTFDYDSAWLQTGDPLATLVLAEFTDQRPEGVLVPDTLLDHTGFWVEIWDDEGVVQYRQLLSSPIEMQTEVMDGGLHIHRLADVRGTFSVVIPQLPRAATLALFGPSPDPDLSGEPSTVLFTFDLTTI